MYLEHSLQVTAGSPQGDSCKLKLAWFLLLHLSFLPYLHPHSFGLMVLLLGGPPVTQDYETSSSHWTLQGGTVAFLCASAPQAASSVKLLTFFQMDETNLAGLGCQHLARLAVSAFLCLIVPGLLIPLLLGGSPPWEGCAARAYCGGWEIPRLQWRLGAGQVVTSQNRHKVP